MIATRMGFTLLPAYLSNDGEFGDAPLLGKWTFLSA
jgi:hypothetical protein